MSIKRVIAVFTALIMLHMVCYSGSPVIFESECGEVKVTVDFGPEYAYKDISMEMSGPFSEIINMENIGNLIENLDVNETKALTQTVFNEKKADGDGKMEYIFYPSEDNKFYILSVHADNDTEIYREIVLNVSTTLEGEIVAQLNAAADEYGIKAVFDADKYYNALVYKHRIFTKIKKDENRMNVYKCLFNAKSEDKFADLGSRYEKLLVPVSALQVISESEDEVQAKAVADEYIDFSYDGDSEAEYFYKAYADFSETEKLSVFKRIIKKTLPTDEAWRKVFEEAVFMQCIQSERYANNLYGFINRYASRFGVNMHTYSSNTAAVNNALYGQYFKDSEDLSAAILTALSGSGSSESSGGKGGSGGGGSYKGNSGSPVNIKPTENAEAVSAVTVFNDIDSVLWAKEAIEELYRKSIVSGDGNGNFYPERAVTREEFLKMLLTAYGRVNGNAVHSFKDSSSSDWHYIYIASGSAAGIVNGINEDIFGVGMPISRQDMAVMTFRASGMTEITETDVFPDDDNVADYAKKAVYALKNRGVLSGNENGEFEPLKNATRAEAAKMIYSMVAD